MTHHHYPVKQGEDDWFSMRLGIPTASEFKKIITPAKQQLSSQHKEYADLKIAEILTGEIQGVFEPTYWMRRGQIMEAEARRAYEFANEVSTETAGFFTDEKGTMGCSPDFLVDDDPEGPGIGEIKCLSAANCVGYMLAPEIPKEFVPQIQGQLMITERNWCDWWMYHPDLSRIKIRTYRDEAFILNLSMCLVQFKESMSKKIEDLQEKGHWNPVKAKKRSEYEDVTVMAG